MEVLKHGKNWEIEHNIINCICGCKYIYNEDDIENLETDTRYFSCIVRCPECGHIYYISLNSKEYEDNSLNIKKER